MIALSSTKLYHRQVYEYAYHRPKIAFLRESREHARFAKLADFLEAVPKTCPHDLFAESARASQTAASVGMPVCSCSRSGEAPVPPSMPSTTMTSAPALAASLTSS